MEGIPLGRRRVSGRYHGTTGVHISVGSRAMYGHKNQPIADIGNQALYESWATAVSINLCVCVQIKKIQVSHAITYD